MNDQIRKKEKNIEETKKEDIKIRKLSKQK